MGIKHKRPGPVPNTPTFLYEWQQLAYEGRVDDAKAAYRRRYSYATPVEANRAVKKFLEENKRVAA